MSEQLDTDPDWLRIERHFPVGADLTLQVLKGHLLVEELLREIFRALLPFPNALRGSRGTSFDCHQVICLVQAISTDSDKELWIWDAAKRLNGIRNDLAHNLEPRSISAKTDSLIEFVTKDNVMGREATSRLGIPQGKEFEAVVMAMCGCLASLKQSLKEKFPDRFT